MLSTGSLWSPLPSKPAVEKVQSVLGLVIWNPVASLKDLEKSKAIMILDPTQRPLVNAMINNAEVLSSEDMAARPLESLCPFLDAEPVADIVSITSIDENIDILQDSGDLAVEGLVVVSVGEELGAYMIAAPFEM